MLACVLKSCKSWVLFPRRCRRTTGSLHKLSWDDRTGNAENAGRWGEAIPGVEWPFLRGCTIWIDRGDSLMRESGGLKWPGEVRLSNDSSNTKVIHPWTVSILLSYLKFKYWSQTFPGQSLYCWAILSSNTEVRHPWIVSIMLSYLKFQKWHNKNGVWGRLPRLWDNTWSKK